MAANRTQRVTLRFEADVTGAKKSLSELNSTLDKITSKKSLSLDLKEASDAAKVLKHSLNDAMNFDTGKLDFSRFTSNISAANTSLNVLVKNLGRAGSTGQSAINQLSTSLSTATIPVKKLSGGLATMLDTLSRTAKWTIASGLIHSMQTAYSSAISYAQNLNKTLVSIQQVSNASLADMERFTVQANAAAKALSTTTKAYADASLIYYQQGDSAEMAAKKAEITLKAANSAFTASAQEMSQMLTATWNAYQVGADQLEHYVDIMAALGANTATSLEEISKSLQKVASTANVTGVSMEKMSSMIATVSSTTRQSAEVVGTAFNTVLGRISSLKLGETLEDGVNLTKYTKALAQIGVNVLDASGELREMGTVIEEIGNKWTTLSTAQKSALASTIGGVRQYTNIMALFNNWDKYKDNLNIANNSTGQLQRMQDIYASGWEGASKRTKAALEGVYETLIDDQAMIKWQNMLATLTEALNSFVKGFGGLPGILITVGQLMNNAFGDKIAQSMGNIAFKAMSFADAVRENTGTKGSSATMAGNVVRTLYQAATGRYVGLEQREQAAGLRQIAAESKYSASTTNNQTLADLYNQRAALSNSQADYISNRTQAGKLMPLGIIDRQQRLDQNARQLEALNTSIGLHETHDKDVTHAQEVLADNSSNIQLAPHFYQGTNNPLKTNADFNKAFQDASAQMLMDYLNGQIKPGSKQETQAISAFQLLTDIKQNGGMNATLQGRVKDFFAPETEQREAIARAQAMREQIYGADYANQMGAVTPEEIAVSSGYRSEHIAALQKTFNVVKGRMDAGEDLTDSESKILAEQMMSGIKGSNIEFTKGVVKNAIDTYQQSDKGAEASRDFLSAMMTKQNAKDYVMDKKIAAADELAQKDRTQVTGHDDRKKALAMGHQLARGEKEAKDSDLYRENEDKTKSKVQSIKDASAKIGQFGQKVQSAALAVGRGFSSINSAIESFKTDNLGAKVSAVSNILTGFASSMAAGLPGMIAFAIGAVAAGIVELVNASDEAAKRIGKDFGENYKKNVTNVKDKTDNAVKVTNDYAALNSKYEEGIIDQATYQASLLETANALGVQGAEVMALQGRYDDLTAAIERTIKAQKQQAGDSAQELFERGKQGTFNLWNAARENDKEGRMRTWDGRLIYNDTTRMFSDSYEYQGEKMSTTSDTIPLEIEREISKYLGLEKTVMEWISGEHSTTSTGSSQGLLMNLLGGTADQNPDDVWDLLWNQAVGKDDDIVFESDYDTLYTAWSRGQQLKRMASDQNVDINTRNWLNSFVDSSEFNSLMDRLWAVIGDTTEARWSAWKAQGSSYLDTQDIDAKEYSADFRQQLIQEVMAAFGDNLGPEGGELYKKAKETAEKLVDDYVSGLVGGSEVTAKYQLREKNYEKASASAKNSRDNWWMTLPGATNAVWDYTSSARLAYIMTNYYPGLFEETQAKNTAYQASKTGITNRYNASSMENVDTLSQINGLYDAAATLGFELPDKAQLSKMSKQELYDLYNDMLVFMETAFTEGIGDADYKAANVKINEIIDREQSAIFDNYIAALQAAGVDSQWYSGAKTIDEIRTRAELAIEADETHVGPEYLDKGDKDQILSLATLYQGEWQDLENSRPAMIPTIPEKTAAQLQSDFEYFQGLKTTIDEIDIEKLDQLNSVFAGRVSVNDWIDMTDLERKKVQLDLMKETLEELASTEGADTNKMKIYAHDIEVLEREINNIDFTNMKAEVTEMTTKWQEMGEAAQSALSVIKSNMSNFGAMSFGDIETLRQNLVDAGIAGEQVAQIIQNIKNAGQADSKDDIWAGMTAATQAALTAMTAFDQQKRGYESLVSQATIDTIDASQAELLPTDPLQVDTHAETVDAEGTPVTGLPTDTEVQTALNAGNKDPLYLPTGTTIEVALELAKANGASDQELTQLEADLNAMFPDGKIDKGIVLTFSNSTEADSVSALNQATAQDATKPISIVYAEDNPDLVKEAQAARTKTITIHYEKTEDIDLYPTNEESGHPQILDEVYAGADNEATQAVVARANEGVGYNNKWHSTVGRAHELATTHPDAYRELMRTAALGFELPDTGYYETQLRADERERYIVDSAEDFYKSLTDFGRTTEGFSEEELEDGMQWDIDFAPTTLFNESSLKIQDYFEKKSADLESALSEETILLDALTQEYQISRWKPDSKAGLNEGQVLQEASMLLSLYENYFVGESDELKEIGMMMIAGVQQGLMEAGVSANWDTILSAMHLAPDIEAAFRAALGIESPSKLTKALAPYLVEGLGVGLEEAIASYEFEENLNGLGLKLAQGFKEQLLLAKEDISKSKAYQSLVEDLLANDADIEFLRKTGSYDEGQLREKAEKMAQERLENGSEDDFVNAESVAYARWFLQGGYKGENSPYDIYEQAAIENAINASLNGVDVESASDEVLYKVFTRVQNNLDKEYTKIVNRTQTLWEDIKDIWSTTLKDIFKFDDDKAQELYDTYVNTFKAIAAARKGLLSGDTLMETFADDEAQLALLLRSGNIQVNERGANGEYKTRQLKDMSFDEIQAWLKSNHDASDITYQHYTPTMSLTGSNAFLNHDNEGHVLYTTKEEYDANRKQAYETMLQDAETANKFFASMAEIINTGNVEANVQTINNKMADGHTLAEFFDVGDGGQYSIKEGADPIQLLNALFGTDFLDQALKSEGYTSQEQIDQGYSETLAQQLIQTNKEQEQAMMDYANAVGYTKQEFEELREEIQETSGLSMDTKGAEEYLNKVTAAVANYKTGLEELQKISKSSWTSMKKEIAAGTNEGRKNITTLRDSMSKMLGVDATKISDTFVTKHLKNLEKMSTGTTKEVQAAEEAIRDDLVATFTDSAQKLKEPIKIKVDADTEEAYNDVTSFFQDAFDRWDGEDLGFTISADTEGAEGQVIAALNNMLDAGIMTADSIEAALNAIGWEPEIEYTVLTAEGKQVGTTTGKLKVGDTFISTSGELTTFAEGMILVPHIKSATKSGSSGSKKPSSSTGGGGNKKKDKKDDNDKERYHQVDRRLTAQNKLLTQNDKLKNRKYGQDYINSLTKENELLQKQIKLNKQKMAEAQAYLAKDKAELSSYGATFDDEGNVDYEAYMDKWIAWYNAKADEYAAGKITDDQWDDIEDQWDDAMKALENYEEAQDIVADMQSEILEAENQMSANNLEKITYKLEVRVELNDQDIARLEYFIKKYSNAYNSLQFASDSFEDMQSKMAEYQDNLYALGEAKASLDAQFASGEINESDYIKGLKEVNEQIIEQLGNIDELDKTMREWYGETLSEARSELDKLTAVMDHENTVMSNYIEILKLTGHEEDYDKMAQIYGAQIEAGMAKSEMLQQHLNTLYEEKEKLEETLELNPDDEYAKQQLEDLETEIRQTEEDVQSSAIETLNAIKNKWLATVDEITKENKKAVSSTGEDLDWVKQKWQWWNDEQEFYVDTVTELYEINKLNRKIEDQISKTRDKNNQRELQMLKEEINLRSKSGQLTKYELEMLDLQYQLLLKKQELEDAQKAKSVVTLTRDENGNYIYQYTADQDLLSQKEQEYEDVLYQINQKADEEYKRLGDKLLSLEEEFANALDTLMRDQNISEEERQKRYAEIMNHYTPLIQATADKMGEVEQNLLTNQSVWTTKYGLDIEKNAQVTNDQTTKIMGNLTKNVGTFIDTCKTNYEQKYQPALTAMQKETERIIGLTNQSWESMQHRIEDVGTKADETKDKASKLNQEMKDGLSGIRDATVAWKAQYEQLKKDVAEYETLNKKITDTIKLLAKLTSSTPTTTPVPDAPSTPATNPPTSSNPDTGGNDDDGTNPGGNGGGKLSIKYKVLCTTGPHKGQSVGGSPTGPSSLKVGETGTVSHNCSTGYAKGGWSISDNSKCSISGGTIKALASGSVTITMNYWDRTEQTGSSGTSSGNSSVTSNLDTSNQRHTVGVVAATGGLANYTGPAWVDGTFTKPEYILNADQTKEMFKILNDKTVSRMVVTLQDATTAMLAGLHGGLTTYGGSTTYGSNMTQEVNIYAEFPAATDRNEIREALNGLVARASQNAVTFVR